jgi:hypothetical protein
MQHHRVITVYFIRGVCRTHGDSLFLDSIALPLDSLTYHVPSTSSVLTEEADSTCVEHQCDSSTPSRDANYPNERVGQKNTLLLCYNVYIISIITTTVSTTISIQLCFPPDV